MVPQDLRLNHRAEVVPGVLAADASALLEQFFRARRRGMNRLET
jgi:tRNA(adenine34) deaminase